MISNRFSSNQTERKKQSQYGQEKNGYGLNYIRAKTLKTLEAWINCIFLEMNLMVLYRICCVRFIKILAYEVFYLAIGKYKFLRTCHD